MGDQANVPSCTFLSLQLFNLHLFTDYPHFAFALKARPGHKRYTNLPPLPSFSHVFCSHRYFQLKSKLDGVGHRNGASETNHDLEDYLD